MEIFKNDDYLDQRDQENDGLTATDLIASLLSKSVGFNFDLDKNKLVKMYDSEPVRARYMNPMSSHTKTLDPFDLVFNSLLAKSKLGYNSVPSGPTL